MDEMYNVKDATKINMMFEGKGWDEYSAGLNFNRGEFLFFASHNQ